MDEAGRLGVQQAGQNHPGHQTSLLEDTKTEWVEINVHAVRTERSRRFGDVWLALELIKKLQLDQFFQDTLASTHAKISWTHLATVLVAARFCEPGKKFVMVSRSNVARRRLVMIMKFSFCAAAQIAKPKKKRFANVSSNESKWA